MPQAPRGRCDPIPRLSQPPGNGPCGATPIAGPRPESVAVSQPKELQQLLDAHSMVPADALQNARQRLCLDRTVERNHFMVLAIDLRGDPDVGTAPPHGLVAQPPKRHQQRGPAHVAGQLHPARTSSRTKCRRISFGRGMASSK